MLINNRITYHYLETYLKVLFQIIAVVITFESLLQLLKMAKHTELFSWSIVDVGLAIIYDLPDKIADILPLAIYIAIGFQHYLWTKKRHWLAAGVMGFSSKNFFYLKLSLALMVLVFSFINASFIAPIGRSLSGLLQEPNIISHQKVFSYQDHNNYYKFVDDKTVYLYDFQHSNFENAPWYQKDKTVYVNQKPIFNFGVVKAQKKKFSSNTLYEKIKLSSTAPQSQKKSLEKSLSATLIHPLCCLLALLLSWKSFPIVLQKRRQRAVNINYFPYVSCCSVLFLMQHITPSLLYTSWESSLLIFMISVLALIIIYLLIENLEKIPGRN